MYGTWDDNYEDWRVGDTIAWDDQREKEKKDKRYSITRFLPNGPITASSWAYWNDPRTGEENMTRVTNLVRITDSNEH